MGLTFALLAATLIPQSATADADLVKAREALIPELITLLITPQYGHHYVSEAAWARETLVAIGDPAVPALIEALKSEDQDVRDAATDALRDLKVKRAVPALKSAFFTTKDQFVRGQILETVAKLDGGLAVDFVIQALDPDNLSSIYSAIYALGETKDPRAIPTLERYLLSPDVPKGDPDRISITRQAAFALSELGAHGLRSLAAAYSSDNQVVREEAADAILGMRELEAVPLVLRVLQGAKDLKDPIGSVWGISDHKAISNAVWAMLESSDLKIRVGATQALENQGDAA
ncbi:MAG: HEAT repeat domain-containing protein, partial [Fimbriimonadaceae bacterium]